MSYCICVKKLRKNIEKSARKIWSVRKNAYLCNPKRKERYFTELQVRKKILGAIAQLVEQRTENPCVPSSILGGTTENPRRCILRGFNFLFLLHLRFVRPRVRGGEGPGRPSVSTLLADDNLRAQRKIPVDLHFIVRLRHKASGAALGLSCAVCFEQPAGVFAGCGAVC